MFVLACRPAMNDIAELSSRERKAVRIFEPELDLMERGDFVEMEVYAGCGTLLLRCCKLWMITLNHET